MEIIKAGELPEKSTENAEQHKYRGTCVKCGAIIECLENELRMTYSMGRHGQKNREEMGRIKCPTEGCGQDIEVTRLEINQVKLTRID